MSVPQYKSVKLVPKGIHILWDDGHQSFYGHRYLRSQCGCAMCFNKMTGKRVVPIEDVPSDVQAMDWMPTGNYAVQFLWSDMHDAGAYPLEVLRGLCQCSVCEGFRVLAG